VSAVVERSEVITSGPAEALAGLVGVPVPDLTALPVLWHWVYLLDRPAQADLGPDGHLATGGVPSPPEPGRRRMWAGGRVRTVGPLRCGEPATRRSYVRDSVDKRGRSGRLTIVTAVHEISQRGGVVVTEEQDIVYREAAAEAPARVGQEPSVPVLPGEWSVPVDPVLLFRFSALTYNGHRIHYDRDYARDVEGYPGLVVHGPLQAILMAESARRRRPSGLSFEYRLVAPLFDHQGCVVSSEPDGAAVATRVRDGSGRTTAVGTYL
jgi:3-methylfumaryl-CoA hydratase